MSPLLKALHHAGISSGANDGKLSLEEFIVLLGEMNILAVDYSPEDLAEEFRVAQ